MTVTFLVLALTVAAFLTNRVRVEIVGLLSMLALVFAGILDTPAALAGFANPMTITIASLFVVGAGLLRTGVADWAAGRIARAGGGSEARLLAMLIVISALLSGFMSNTGTVAVLIPTVVAMARELGLPPARFLLPMAFGAQLGGLLTLVGTPPNLVVSNALVAAGRDRLGFFELATIGVPVLVVFVAYAISPARRFLGAATPVEAPTGASIGELAGAYGLEGRLFRLRLREGSSLAGRTLESCGFTGRGGMQVLDLQRGRSGRAGFRRWVRGARRRADVPDPGAILEPRCVLVVAGRESEVRALANEADLDVDVVSPRTQRLAREIGLAEVVVTQHSRLNGKTLAEERFGSRYGVRVLGVLRAGAPLDLPFVDTRLAFGDTLLVYGAWESIDLMRQDRRNFVVVGDAESLRARAALTGRSFVAIGCVAAMVSAIVSGAVPVVFAVVSTGVAMIGLGCVRAETAYRAVHWPSVILIAAMIPMGTALERTGGVGYLANGITDWVGDGSPYLLLGGVYALTMILSQFISNTATTILVAPVAVGTAQSLGVAAEPVLVMVAAGASSAFLTPVASPVNTLVMGPGGYRFGDYARFGLPVVVVVFVVSILLVPLVWPLP